MARHCPMQQECPKCKGAHCGLLHSDSFKAAQAPKDATQEPETRTQEEKKVNAVKSVVYQRRQAEDCVASVPLISLTAVKKEAGMERTKPFYALIDTGADTSLCTRELVEELFGWNPEESINIKFLEKDSEDYPCMKQPLVLQYGNEENVALQDIPFVDAKLPYHQCIPNPSILQKYGLSEETFPAVSGDHRRVDMIFGANDMRKLQILKNCEWKDSELLNH